MDKSSATFFMEQDHSVYNSSCIKFILCMNIKTSKIISSLLIIFTLVQFINTIDIIRPVLQYKTSRIERSVKIEPRTIFDKNRKECNRSIQRRSNKQDTMQIDE